jgi:hypothetical protein
MRKKKRKKKEKNNKNKIFESDRPPLLASMGMADHP